MLNTVHARHYLWNRCSCAMALCGHNTRHQATCHAWVVEEWECDFLWDCCTSWSRKAPRKGIHSVCFGSANTPGCDNHGQLGHRQIASGRCDSANCQINNTGALQMCKMLPWPRKGKLVFSFFLFFQLICILKWKIIFMWGKKPHVQKVLQGTGPVPSLHVVFYVCLLLSCRAQLKKETSKDSITFYPAKRHPSVSNEECSQWIWPWKIHFHFQITIKSEYTSHGANECKNWCRADYWLSLAHVLQNILVNRNMFVVQTDA